MKFYSDRIRITPISLEEAAARAKDAKSVSSLDEILAKIDNQKQVKTAAAATPVVKTAEAAPAKVEEPKAEVKTAAVEEKKANLDNLGDAKAPPFGKKEEEKKDEPKKDEKGEKKEDKKDEPEKEEMKKEESAKPVSLKVAKSLDFRGWEAEDVVKAWGQHGNFEKCCANVKGKVNDEKTYCGLLQVASNEAGKIIKQAAAEKQEKVASKVEKTARFKKLAKLTEEERAALAKYWGQMYGEGYVKAMLEDY